MAVKKKVSSQSRVPAKKAKKLSKKPAAPKTRKKTEVEARPVVAEIIEPGQEMESPAQTDEIFPHIPDGDSDFDPLDLPEIEAPVAKKKSGLPLPVAKDSEKGLTPADPISTYLSELRKYPLLTPEQERELAIRYRESGDPKAAELLVTSNLRFVVKVAAEYSKFGARLIDLIQEGNIGLMQAVREFNPYKGVRLITYAVWWIRGYIQEYLMRQYSLVRIGTTQNQRKLFYQLQKKREELEAMGQEPDYALLSSRLGIPAKEIESMQQRLTGRDISLNQPLDDESQSSLMDLQTSATDQGVDEQLGHQEELFRLRENLDQLREKLNERELYLLDNRLLADEPMTLQEIGERYGTTREAVRQMEQRLLGKIKKRFQASINPDSEDEA